MRKWKVRLRYRQAQPPAVRVSMGNRAYPRTPGLSVPGIAAKGTIA